MSKRLRFSLMVVMMVVCGTMSAQDIIWQEDWSGLAETDIKVDPNTVSFGYDYSFTGTTFKDDGSYSGGTGFYNEALSGGNAPELLVAKNGGTFTAKVNLGGKSGETKLAWKCNNSNLSITISTQNEEIELSTANVVGYDRELTFNIPSGVSELTITFTNPKSGNCRLDDIKLYQGQGKKPAGLSWGTSSRTVTIGTEDNQFPTLSNENQVNVVFNSSNTDVATISAGGDITLIGPGKTDISAAFFGDDEFEAQTVTYTLTVKEAQDMTQYTVSQALDIINQLDEGATTDKEYYVKGKVTEIKEIPTSDNKANFYISDGTNVLYIFKAKGLQKKDITAADYLNIDDEVVVFGKLQKYKNKDGEITPEVTSGGYICELNGKTEDEGGETPVEIKTVTVAEFIAAEVSNSVWYQLTGTISGLQENDLYGFFDLTDATGTVYVYGVLSEKGGDKQLFQQLVSQYGIKNGSKITIVGNRGYYAAQEKIEVTNAYFISVENVEGDVNGDRILNGTDLVALVNILMRGDGSYISLADVNGDGLVNGTDIVALVNLIMAADPAKDMIPDYFASTNNNGIPEGYVVDFNGEQRTSENSYSSGSRLFDFAAGGDFTKGLYFREGTVTYGTVEGHELILEAGKAYNLHFNSAMWKSNGTTMTFDILNDAEESVLNQTITNSPDVNGNTGAPVNNSTSTDIKFVPDADGNYFLRWASNGFAEVLLANVRMKYVPNVMGSEETTLQATALENAKEYMAARAIGMSSSQPKAIIGAEPMKTNSDGSRELTVTLHNPLMDVTMVQMDMTLPEGLSLNSDEVMLTGRMSLRTHQVYTGNTDDDTVRLLLASGKNALIEGTEGAILRLKLTASENFSGGDIVLHNMLCTSPDLTESRPDAYVIHVGDATRLNDKVQMANDKPGDMYNLGGQRISVPQKGVNIINGKKVVK